MTGLADLGWLIWAEPPPSGISGPSVPARLMVASGEVAQVGTVQEAKNK